MQHLLRGGLCMVNMMLDCLHDQDCETRHDADTDPKTYFERFIAYGRNGQKQQAEVGRFVYKKNEY